MSVEGQRIAKIGSGLLVFLGVQRGDDGLVADRLLHKVLSYRVFADSLGRMNASLLDVQGDLLVVSQFTLAANTGKGLRPSFSSAADPALAEGLYDYFLRCAAAKVGRVAGGRFGADMAVSLTNDGPVTFWLEVSPTPSA